MLPAILLRFLPYGIAVIAALGAVWAIYAKGVSDERNERQVETLQTEIEVRDRRIAREAEARAQDAQRAEDAQERLTALNNRVGGLTSYVASLEDNRMCLDSDDTDELRKLWE